MNVVIQNIALLYLFDLFKNEVHSKFAFQDEEIVIRDPAVIDKLGFRFEKFSVEADMSMLSEFTKIVTVELFKITRDRGFPKSYIMNLLSEYFGESFAKFSNC